MIDPEGIRRKAQNLYPTFLCAWLAGEEFFPRTVPCSKQLDDNLAIAAAAVQRLREAAKESCGYGYSIEWQQKNSRSHGKNQFPRRILFQSQQDLLRFAGREKQFAKFAAAVDKIRARFPVLQDWIRGHRKRLVDVADDVEGLLEVAAYLVAHPRPNLFARELPLSVDTKFVQRNQRVLREWLDLILPPHTISADEEHFERRYGLSYAEPLILIRFLDDAGRQAAEFPWETCAVPLHSLASAPVRPQRVLVVENKVNLLTLPPSLGTIALGGLGNAASDLRYLPWLAKSDVWYWGDMDCEGFAILSRLRAVLPGVRSFLMDSNTFTKWKDLASQGSGQRVAIPVNLTAHERAVFDDCLENDLRIEQERIPQSAVQDEWNRAFVSRVSQDDLHR